jgi:hypothetical protein
VHICMQTPYTSMLFRNQDRFLLQISKLCKSIEQLLTPPTGDKVRPVSLERAHQAQ